VARVKNWAQLNLFNAWKRRNRAIHTIDSEKDSHTGLLRNIKGFGSIDKFYQKIMIKKVTVGWFIGF
jgi:hypothetical protein